MAEAIINTSFGAKTPLEAMGMLLEAIPEGARVGIFNQLAAKAPDQAREVAQAVMKNPGTYGPLIDKAVKKFVGSAGCTKGPQKVRDGHQLLRIFGERHTWKRLRLKFKHEAVYYMHGFYRLLNEQVLKLDNHTEVVNVVAVLQSGAWGNGLNRAYVVLIGPRFVGSERLIADLIGPGLETIEPLQD